MSWLSAWTGDSSPVKARGLSPCTDGQPMVQLHVLFKRLIIADYLHDHGVASTPELATR